MFLRKQLFCGVVAGILVEISETYEAFVDCDPGFAKGFLEPGQASACVGEVLRPGDRRDLSVIQIERQARRRATAPLFWKARSSSSVSARRTIDDTGNFPIQEEC